MLNFNQAYFLNKTTLYTPRELKKFLKIAQTAARRAAKIQKKGYGKKHVHNMKLGLDFATEVDLESEKVILEILKKHFPTHAFVAEESKNAEKDLKAEYCWVIDPLDGTHCFANEIPFFGPSIALLYKGKPIVGVINFPMLGEEYTATIGGGTYFNGKKVNLKNVANFKGCQLVSGQSLLLSGKMAKKLKENFGSVFILPSAIECARRFLSGLVPVCPGHYNHKVWDIAAVVLLLEEAGAKVSDWRGRKIKLDTIYPKVGICYATSRSYKKFISLIKKYAAK